MVIQAAYLVSLGFKLKVVVLVMVGTLDPRLACRLRCMSRYQLTSRGEYCCNSDLPRIIDSQWTTARLMAMTAKI